MNLRDLGKRYECAEARLWVLSALSPLKASLVQAELERVQPSDKNADIHGNHIINNARSVFSILEVYILDAEWKTTEDEVENTIETYWFAREGEDIATRWKLFTYLVDPVQWGFLIDAWQFAQPKELLTTTEDSDEKKEFSLS